MWCRSGSDTTKKEECIELDWTHAVDEWRGGNHGRQKKVNRYGEGEEGLE